MFKKILEFFFSKRSQGPIKQTGIIVVEPKPSDWIADEETGIVSAARALDGDWRPYEPTGEKQYRVLSFDSLSCATFSGLNTVETFMRYYSSKLMLSKEHIEYFRLFGFIDENKFFNASDNFTAIMSGTSVKGNTLPAVWDSIKNHGLIAEKDFPFESDTFAEYHNKARISEYLKRRALKFKDFFTVNYQWVTFSQGNVPTIGEVNKMRDFMKQAPLHIAVPIPAAHAELLVLLNPDNSKTMFNSYEPYEQDNEPADNPIHFSLMGVVTPKLNVPKYPVYNFTMRMAVGSTGMEVTALQKVLSYFGFMNLVTGYYGSVTEMAVEEFQTFHGVTPLGIVGPLTIGLLNSFNNLVEKTPAQIFLETAKKCLNQDVTPEDKVSDDVDCANTVNRIYKIAFGEEIGGGASTYELYQRLLKHPKFIQVSSPEPGDVYISPTGFGTNPAMPHGHVGIVGEGGSIMSNDSRDGKFKQNYTFESWRQYYVNRGGYPVRIFKRI